MGTLGGGYVYINVNSYKRIIASFLKYMRCYVKFVC